jgi:hypothetical protein
MPLSAGVHSLMTGDLARRDLLPGLFNAPDPHGIVRPV